MGFWACLCVLLQLGDPDLGANKEIIHELLFALYAGFIKCITLEERRLFSGLLDRLQIEWQLSKTNPLVIWIKVRSTPLALQEFRQCVLFPVPGKGTWRWGASS